MKNNIFTKAIPIVIALILPLCLNAQNEAYKNPALSFDQRVDDLIKRLTLEEKVSLMQDASKPIERLQLVERGFTRCCQSRLSYCIPPAHRNGSNL